MDSVCQMLSSKYFTTNVKEDVSDKSSYILEYANVNGITYCSVKVCFNESTGIYETFNMDGQPVDTFQIPNI